jgi:hypothetical protein
MNALTYFGSLLPLLLLAASVGRLNGNLSETKLSGFFGTLNNSTVTQLDAKRPHYELGLFGDLLTRAQATGGESSAIDSEVDTRSVSNSEKNEGVKTLNTVRRQAGAANMMYTVSTRLCTCCQ